MFKINNKNTRMTSLRLLLFCVSIVGFEQVNISWEVEHCIKLISVTLIRSNKKSRFSRNRKYKVLVFGK